jgi:hypothetical protein
VKVVHCKKDDYDVYIGRPGPWGNPWSHSKFSAAEHIVDTREEAIRNYRNYLYSNPELIEKARIELKGKVLGCWCAPQACHGDILAEVANSE